MKKIHIILLLSFLLSISSTLAFADTSLLKLQKINDIAYAVVGPFGNRNAQNLGNNSTSGFVITEDGVVLIDSGGSYKGAQEIESKIKTVTDKPITTVINSGGQDHRWLGNGYFKDQGARIIASAAAVADQKARVNEQLFSLSNLVGDAGMENTSAVFANEVFEERLDLTVGGIEFSLHHSGQAHTPGDSYIHIADMNLVFTGDIVYIGRMLGVNSHSGSKSWVGVYKQMARLKPLTIVPGHGPVTDLEIAGRDTLRYLLTLREKVGRFIEDGGQIEDISEIDQSEFAYLESFDELKGRNAQQVYQEMEWE